MISQLQSAETQYTPQNQFNTNKASSKVLVSLFTKFIIYGLMIVGLAEFLMRQVANEQQEMKFSEESHVEALQSLFLLFSIMALGYAIVVHKNWRPLLFLIAEFIFVSFIREQDAYLDLHYFDGAWQTIVFLSLPFPIYFAIRKWKLLLENLRLYTSLFSFGIMLSGVLTTYVFSRLYGRKVFWMAAMENGYMRDVKNISEESLETYGYLLILIACVELVLVIQRLDSKSRKAITTIPNTNKEHLKIST